jgi:hypothetical protein
MVALLAGMLEAIAVFCIVAEFAIAVPYQND